MDLGDSSISAFEHGYRSYVPGVTCVSTEVWVTLQCWRDQCGLLLELIVV